MGDCLSTHLGMERQGGYFALPGVVAEPVDPLLEPGVVLEEPELPVPPMSPLVLPLGLAELLVPVEP